MGTEHQAEDASHLRDFTFATHESHDVDAAVEHRYTGHLPLDAGSCAKDVEYGDDHRLRGGSPLDQLCNRSDGVPLDADKDDIHLIRKLLSRCGRYMERMFTLQVAMQAKSVCAQRLQMFTPGNAAHLFAGQRQEARYATSYATCAYNQVAQFLIVCIHIDTYYKKDSYSASL